MTDVERMRRVDALLTHVWMVRTFLKHSDEATEDDELRHVHRGLYDYSLALGESWTKNDAPAYLRLAKKKLGRLRGAADLFLRIQPEVSLHTNFQMAARSLSAAVGEIESLLRPAE